MRNKTTQVYPDGANVKHLSLFVNKILLLKAVGRSGQFDESIGFPVKMFFTRDYYDFVRLRF